MEQNANLAQHNVLLALIIIRVDLAMVIELYQMDLVFVVKNNILSQIHIYVSLVTIAVIHAKLSFAV